jgi:hypothetical protein
MGNNSSKKIAKYFFIFLSVVALGMVTYVVNFDRTNSRGKRFIAVISPLVSGHLWWHGIPPTQ